MSGEAQQRCSCGSGKRFLRCCGVRTPQGETVAVVLQRALTALAAGQLLQARQSAETLLRVNPRHGEALLILGSVALQQEQFADAVRLWTKARAILPEKQEKIAYGLALAWQGLKNPERALSFFTQATEGKEAPLAAWWGRSVLLLERGQAREAEVALRQVLARQPDHVGALSNLSAALKQQNRWTAALTYAEQAVALQPAEPVLWRNLALLCQEWGAHEQANNAFAQAIKLNPYDDLSHSSRLFGLNYLMQWTPAQRCAEAQAWGQQLQQQAQQEYPVWSSWPQPQQKKVLTIGLVSGDLRRHPVGYFLHSVLHTLQALQDATARENPGLTLRVLVYMTAAEDGLSLQLQKYCQGWLNVTEFSDRALAERIYADAVQILIDLSGHTRHNRLKVFCWHPAPLQLTWLGYFATTGLPAMDYILLDPWVQPPTAPYPFTERPLWLKDTYRCFTPPAPQWLPGPLPMQQAGQITFGCFNHLNKLNDQVLTLWGSILRELPQARLLLKSRQTGDAADQQAFLQRAQRCALPTQQLILEGVSEYAEYLRAYERVDLALDPFPYTGATVSLEGIWMGIPMLTLQGEDMLGRSGAQILQHLQLPMFIAENQEDYRDKALWWAQQPEALAGLRRELRQRLLNSVLCDAQAFVKEWSQGLASLWQEYSHRQGGLT